MVVKLEENNIFSLCCNQIVSTNFFVFIPKTKSRTSGKNKKTTFLLIEVKISRSYILVCLLPFSTTIGIPC